MNGIAARFGWFGAGLFCLVTVGWVLAGPVGKPAPRGLPMDWTHRHVIFSQPATAEQARLLADEPRFWQQEYRRQAMRVESDGMAAPEETNSLGLAIKGISAAKVHRDWYQDLGSGASVGAGNYPAKYGFQVNVANCGLSGSPQDFVVFGTGVSGGPTQASIVAYDNLYSGCTGTVPQVYWAYNLNGGYIPMSPVFSQDGTQLAFAGTNGITAKLVLLTWQSSTTESVTNPLLLLPTGVDSYFGCTAPCMTTLQLIDGNGVNTLDNTSSVFYDYGLDIAWLGDSGGWLHQFHPVFNGTPAEIRSGGWPVQVNPGNPMPLSNPVHDRVSHQVFVGDLGGYLARVDDSTGAVTLSGRLDSGVGLAAGPIVDPTAGFVYAFASNDGTTACGGAPCSAVYALATNFAATTTGNEVAVGTSSATPKPLYAGGFDSVYLSSNNGTGRLFVCGNTGGAPTLYKVGIGTGVWSLPITTGPVLASTPTGCSPVTDIPNPNATGGGTEWVFASVQNSGSGNSCASGGCLMNFKDQPWQASTAFIVGQQVLDSHFQVQVVRVAGTSKATQPAWNTTVGGTTNDNTVRWLNQGPQVAAHNATWIASHAYSLNTVLLDTNKNIQLVITAGTSRTGAHPNWNVNVNGVTNDGSVRWRNLGSVATASFASTGGTSGIIIDNTVGTGTMAGASQVYFSTQGNQTCGTSGTGGCAVQASQSALQ